MDPALAGEVDAIGNPRLSVIRRFPADTASASSGFQARTQSIAVAPSAASTGAAFTNTPMVTAERAAPLPAGRTGGGASRDMPHPRSNRARVANSGRSSPKNEAFRADELPGPAVP